MMSGMAGERNQLREEKKRVESELESTRMQLEELIQQQKNQNVELDQYKVTGIVSSRVVTLAK